MILGDLGTKALEDCLAQLADAEASKKWSRVHIEYSIVESVYELLAVPENEIEAHARNSALCLNVKLAEPIKNWKLE